MATLEILLLAGSEPGRGFKPTVTSGKVAQETASSPGNSSIEDSFLEWVMETPTKKQSLLDLLLTNAEKIK